MWQKIKNIKNKEQILFWLGLVIVIAATTIETMRGRALNYYVFSDASNMFWHGLTPYTQQFITDHGRYFLYTPVFTALFAPVLLLPQWLGPYVWNGMLYALMVTAIRTLPGEVNQYRTKIFAFLLLLIVQGTYCFQYNLVVCALFLLAFTLLERNKPLWAVLLIMISATTKIYGGIELALLLCYPKMWRNLGAAVLMGIVLLLLPAMYLNFEHPLDVYRQMGEILTQHGDSGIWAGLLYAPVLRDVLLPNMRIVQLGALVILSVIFFWKKRLWSDFRFRVSALAVMGGYVILFSDSPETHTYIIALAGYQMVFWLQPKRTTFDWVIFWLLFVNFCIFPIDVLCPTPVYRFFHWNFWLDIYCMTLAWVRIIWAVAKS